MAKPFIISKPNSSTLQFIASRRHAAIKLCSLAAFYTFWYVFQIGFHGGPANLINKVMNRDWFTILFVVAPLLSLGEIFRSLVNLTSPRVISLDSESNRIEDRGKPARKYDEVSGVQIKTIKDSDGPDEFALSITFHGPTKMRIIQGKNYEDIFEIADEIAEWLKVKIEKV